jgi:hypothetical protein
MAADANLIRGARDAASGASKMTMAGGELGRAAQGLIGRVDARTAELKVKTEEAKERSRQLDTIADARMEDAMLKASALGEAEYDLNSEKVNKWKAELNRCALGDEACKREIMSKMSIQSQSLQSEKEAREDNKELYKTLSLGVNPIDKYAMSVFSDPQKGDYTLTEDSKGVKTYTIKYPEGMELPIDPETGKPKNTYTDQEINKLFNKQHDLTSTKMTKDMAVDQIKIGAEGGAFNETKIKGSYEDAIGDDLMSAINDDWGLGSFRKNAEDLVKAELAKPGTSLVDFDKDGVEDDIKIVMAALTDPNDANYALMSDEVRKEYVVNYFVDAQKQQHAKGVKEAGDAMLAAQRKEANKYLFEEFKNNLKIGLDGAQTQNDIVKAWQDHLNKLDQIKIEEENLIGRDDKKKSLDQQAVIDYWNKKVIPKSEEERLEFNKQGPTDKAQHFSREIKTATGDNTINIKYSGKPFTDSSGRQVSGGYYTPQQEDVIDPETGLVTGDKKQVFQLISEGDNIEATDILAFIKKGKSIGSFASNTNSLANEGTGR